MLKRDVFFLSRRTYNLKGALSDTDKAAAVLMSGRSRVGGSQKSREVERLWPRRKTGNEMEEARGAREEEIRGTRQRETSERVSQIQ